MALPPGYHCGSYGPGGDERQTRCGPTPPAQAIGLGARRQPVDSLPGADRRLLGSGQHPHGPRLARRSLLPGRSAARSFGAGGRRRGARPPSLSSAALSPRPPASSTPRQSRRTPPPPLPPHPAGMAEGETPAPTQRAGRGRGKMGAVAIAAARRTPGFLGRVLLPVQDDPALLPPPVVATTKNPSVVNERRADRDAALGETQLRFLDRRAQEFVHRALLSVAARNVLPPGGAHRSWDGRGHGAPADDQV